MNETPKSVRSSGSRRQRRQGSRQPASPLTSRCNATYGVGQAAPRRSRSRSTLPGIDSPSRIARGVEFGAQEQSVVTRAPRWFSSLFA